MGTVFNIQHFSIHDGPGVRTVVFFKGCNLACSWCHNPESIDMHPKLMYYGEKCIGCRACIDVCPAGCHTQVEGIHCFDPTACTQCFKCASLCYAEALTTVGEAVTVDYVLDAILSNKEYFKQSGGGVTFSGGECMLQIDFLHSLLVECKRHNIHTAVDTAGHVPFSHFERIMECTDLFLYDFKAFSEERHKAHTGVSNELIKSNFEALVAAGCNIIVRIPLVNSLNDNELPQIAEYLNQYPHIKVEVLPYHSMGSSKYAALGKTDRVLSKDTEWLYTPSGTDTQNAEKLFLGANLI